MKIGVFVYDFPHFKSQQGLLNLFVEGIKPDVVFAQEKKKLNITYSAIRIIPSWLAVNHPRHISSAMGLYYNVGDHDSVKVVSLIKSMDLDLGVVLGARILKKETIEAFNIGVLNMHPGIIPVNRGLDNIKWAVLDNIKQGVTGHLIDDRVDMGEVIDIRIVPVHYNDSLMDIHLRVQDIEQIMMVDIVKAYHEGEVRTIPVASKGKYHRSLSSEEEMRLLNQFDYYKQNYETMK